MMLSLKKNYHQELNFKNKEEIIDFIVRIKKVSSDLKIKIPNENQIFNQFINKSKNESKSSYIKIDKVINGNLTKLYNAIVSNNMSPELIDNFFQIDSNLDFKDFLNSFLYILKYLTQNNETQIVLDWLEYFVGGIIYPSLFNNKEVSEEYIEKIIVNIIFSIINNKREKWGLKFIIETKTQLDRLISLMIEFFKNSGLSTSSRKQIWELLKERDEDSLINLY